MNQTKLTCPKCGSSNIAFQAVTTIKNKHHGFLWWLFIGFWWVPLKWLLFFLPALIIKIFVGKKVKSVVTSEAVCQNCGNHWTAR